MAGGNGILSVLGSPGVQMDNGMTSPQAAMAGPVSVANSTGSSAPLGHVQIATAALLLLSVAVLIAMNKAGFRFSVTVG
jgi:membrane-associated phospholipid phosphatase